MLLVVVFLSAVAAVYFAAELATLPAQQRARALQRAVARRRSAEVVLGKEQRSFRARVLDPLGPRLAALALRLSPSTTQETVRRRLLAAGMGKTSPTAFLATKGAAAAAGLVFALLVGAAAGPATGLGLGLALAAVGFVLPDRILASRTRARQERIRAGLPDALELLAVSVEAGLGLDAAVSQLTQHLSGPLVEEFSHTLSEMRIGRSRNDALRAMAERVDVPELNAFARSVVQAQQLGASIGRTLLVQAADARQRRQAAAEEKAMKAPVKMLFPTVLFIFPSLFIVVLGPALLNFGRVFG